jgi:nucleoside-diphosphate-sugar epimerase
VGHSVINVLEAVERVVGRSAVVQFVPAVRHDVHSIVLDIAKLQSLVDYQPTPFEDGVRRTHAAISAGSALRGAGRRSGGRAVPAR